MKYWFIRKVRNLGIWLYHDSTIWGHKYSQKHQAEILVFLLGAMTIVEIIDYFNGFATIKHDWFRCKISKYVLMRLFDPHKRLFFE